MRIPKYTITELKKKQRSENKGKKLINPRTERKHEQQQDKLLKRWSTYRSEQTIKRQTKRKKEKLWKSTQKKIKGKSREQIKNIYNSYKSKKENLISVQGERITQLSVKDIKLRKLNYEDKKSLFHDSKNIGGKSKGHFKTAKTNQYFFEFPKSDFRLRLENFLHNLKEKPRYILVIINVQNEDTKQLVSLSDSFTFNDLVFSVQDIDFLDDLYSYLSKKESAPEKIKIINYSIRLIYEDSQALKKNKY